MAVAADAGEGGGKSRVVAHAEIAQDGPAHLVRAEGEPGAAERAGQDRAAPLERDALEGQWALGRRGIANGDAAMADRTEIERPTVLARETLHVRRRRVD